MFRSLEQYTIVIRYAVCCFCRDTYTFPFLGALTVYTLSGGLFSLSVQQTTPPLILSVSHMSSCPLHTNSGFGKSEAHNNWSMVTPEKGAPITGTTVRLTAGLAVTANSRRQ